MVVYKKTLKGMDELLARDPTIHPKLVSVLLLVDGVRDASEIVRLANDAELPADALEMLVHGGFLESRLTENRHSHSATAASTPKAPAKAPQVKNSSGFHGFQRLYAYLVGQAKALLGLRGFMFQLRIERAATLEELQDVLTSLGMAIEKKHGEELARVFRRESGLLMRAAFAERKYLGLQGAEKTRPEQDVGSRG